MQDRELLSITVVTDDSTGCYVVGEMDYGVPSDTRDWLQQEGNRKKLADWLEELSKRCREERPPFGDKYPTTEPPQAKDVKDE